MKKLSFLMLLALAFLLSCRIDQFPEKETYNNTSAFQLTNKRISLNESKHKVKLTAELSKAKDEFKSFAKKNKQGKTVNLGDSISVNTDDVIYMENGPNYHTYTFSIQRNNLLLDAPVENLVFTPLPDGGYKAYLVTYNFTEAEKSIILNGGNVSVSDKSSVTPLEGIFTSVMSVDNCTMQINDYYTVCDGNLKHSNGETEAQGCTATNKSQHIVSMTMVCQGGLSPQPGIEGSVDYGSGESGGAVPCSANGVYLSPQDPAQSGCNAGVPTLPNISPNRDLINELQGYPCAQSLVQQLPNLKNDLAMSMKQIFQNNKNYSIIFRPKSGLGNIDGETNVISSTEFDNFKAIISINDQVLTNATKEYILVTLYHEVIHAFLRYELFKLGTIAFHEKYLGVVVGYDYDSNGNVINRFTFLPQHQEVGAFLSTLENILSLYNPTLSSATIKAMAKAGITTMTQTEAQLNDNERNTMLGNYQGTKCP